MFPRDEGGFDNTIASIKSMSRQLRMLDDPNGLVEITSRTQHGRFLMRPSEEVNELILGVLGRAQTKYDVVLHAFVFLANHYHLLTTMRSAEQMSLFTGFLNGNLAKELGRLHGWREKFWGRRYHSASVNFTEQDQVKRFLYILDNSCKEGLVASPLDWPGVSSATALYNGETKLQGIWYDRTAQYRAHLQGEYKRFPYTETVKLTPLPFLQERSVSEQRAFHVDALRDIEAKTVQMHQEKGTTPIGARAIRRQKPHDMPTTFKRSPAPIFHAANREDFWAMYNARNTKVAAYRDAAQRLKQGETDVRFPGGCFPPRLPFVESRAPT
jgi:REP element-mobilizing transposase RayT